MSEVEYRAFALGDDSGRWELVAGQLREKPWMSVTHSRVTMDLVEQLLLQLDRDRFRVTAGLARLRVSSDTYYIPDVVVIPTEVMLALGENPRALDAYPDPLPLVAEVWSPSTGTYDIDVKLPGYQRRGDLKIWFIHPLERTLAAWSRQPNGAYTETVYRSGIVEPPPLPSVVIDVDELFAP
jgi:Uma2 family endonuclease